MTLGASQVGLVLKNLLANIGDLRDQGLIPGWARSPEEGYGNPLQYSFLEIPWTEEPKVPQSIGSQSQTRLKQLSTQHKMTLTTYAA